MREERHRPTGATKRTMRRLLRFADISRDMERNRNDSAFIDGGGKVVYVLDQNIFEMFVQPSARTRAVESFYSTALGGQARTAIRYEAQCALIASEHLVCGALPGSRDGVIYMTEQHWVELAYRIAEMHDDMRRKMGLPVQANLLSRKSAQRGRVIGPDDVIEAFRIKFEAMHDLVNQTPRPQTRQERRVRHAALDKDLSTDLVDLANRSVPPAVVNRVSVTRTAAEILSTDLDAEPLDQLRRLVTPSVRNRIHRLQSRYPCTDMAEVEADTKRWQRRLDREESRPRNQWESRQPGKERSRRALKNDARSIAYLRWVARTCIPAGQRLVFVTGDTLVFDTYRRWYAKGRALPDEPFFMRRAAQYSPIFIPTDSGGDLSHERFLPAGRHSIFDRMQGAIEATLIPLTFSTARGGADADGVFARRREQLALRSADLEDEDDKDTAKGAADLPAKISSDWLKDQGGQLTRVVNLWRAAQRLTIGASYDLIASRLTDEQRRIAEQVARGTAEEAASALSDYAQDVTSSLLDGSLQFFLGHAREFLERKAQDRDRATPPFKRLSVAFDLGNLGIGPEMWDRPEIVFARAACLALDDQDAHNAHHFAKLALRADDAARARGPTAAIAGLEQELRYLIAVTARMLLCTVESHLRRPGKDGDPLRAVRRGVDQVKDIYAQAADAIHGVIRFHYNAMTKADGSWDTYHAVRYLRGLSERASLHLFTATSFALIRNGRQAGVGIHDTRDFLTIALGDLRRCAIFDRKKWLDGESLIWAVRDQYAPNVAGYETLAYLVEPAKSYAPDQWPQSALRRLGDFQKREKHPHPLLAAELRTFSRLVPGILKTETRRPAPERDKNRVKMPLFLDQVLLNRINAKLFGPKRQSKNPSEQAAKPKSQPTPVS